ncbi:BatA domain-containing protein [Desulfobacterales bacterium HSG2]|nr:BatA domain-containing protein [Desulfobacterales bacterium HSG2]
MMFSLTTPLAFLAIVGVPALIVIYLLRSRFRKYKVSSIMLWENLSPAKQTGLRLRRFQTGLLFFLELLIILLLVTAASGPMILTDDKSRPLAVILDDSVSMRAEKNGESFRDKGLEAIEKIIRHGQYRPIRFILAGRRPRIMAHSARTPDQAMKALEDWRCFAPYSELEQAMGIASQISGETALLLIITDHARPAGISDPRIQWQAVGAPLPNTGFANAARSAAEDKDRCLLEIVNFSDKAVETTLKINTEQRPLRLEPRGRKRMIFNLPKSAVLSAELGSDSLSEDNRILLYPNPIKKVGVEIRIADEKMRRLLARAVEASGLTAPGVSGYDILFTDKKEAVPPVRDCWMVHVISEKEAAAYKGPFVTDPSHPLLKGIFLEGVIWGAGKAERMPGTPVISVGNIPVLTEAETLSGTRRIYLRLNTDLSTFHQTPAWPALIWNLLNWRVSELPGLQESNLRVGTQISFVPETDVNEIRITPPGHESRRIPVTDGKAVIEPEQPGGYAVRAGRTEFLFAANMLAPDESNLTTCTSGKWGNWTSSELIRQDYYPLAWVFLLLALTGLFAHLILSSF